MMRKAKRRASEEWSVSIAGYFRENKKMFRRGINEVRKCSQRVIYVCAKFKGEGIGLGGWK